MSDWDCHMDRWEERLDRKMARMQEKMQRVRERMERYRGPAAGDSVRPRAATAPSTTIAPRR